MRTFIKSILYLALLVISTITFSQEITVDASQPNPAYSQNNKLITIKLVNTKNATYELFVMEGDNPKKLEPKEEGSFEFDVSKELTQPDSKTFKIKGGNPVKEKTFIVHIENSTTETNPQDTTNYCSGSFENLKSGDIIPPVAPYGPAGNDRNNDYTVVYDLATNEPSINYFKHNLKNSEYENKKRLSPKVSKNVGFLIFGYYPSFDSLTFSYQFESKNDELRDDFLQVITPQKTSDSTSKEDMPAAEENDEVEGISKTTKDYKNAFEYLFDDFYGYYQNLVTYHPDQSLVELDKVYITDRLDAYCLFSEKRTVGGLLNGLLKKANEDTVNREKLINTAHQIVRYYAYILNYSTMKIPVIQMKNEDSFNFNFAYYKNGQKVATSDHHLLISGGWKIDFSSGFIFHNLLDHEYEIKSDSSIQAQDGSDSLNFSTIVKKDNGQSNIDIGVLSHVYPRTGTRVNAGFTTGFILDNGETVRYLFGGSVMLGYEQRFILSGGWIGGKVDRLDNSYRTVIDGYVPSTSLSSLSSSVPTNSKWDNGWFFGITYNLGGTNLANKK